MKILPFILIYILASCAKEYSCEDCTGFRLPPLTQPTKFPPRDTTAVDTTFVDTIPQTPVDTTWNNLISHYKFHIDKNSDIRKLYFCVQTKYIPGHYHITDSIPVQTSLSSYYDGSFNIWNYPIYPMNQYKKGDVFKTYIEIRYKNGNTVQTDSTTLKL